MEKLDLRKNLKHLYSPRTNRVELVQVPAFPFLMVDGAIEPGKAPGTSPLFQENIQALYSIAYTLKFMLKQCQQDAVDYPVMALEGLWWVEDGHFDVQVKDNWFYTILILQPELITHTLFAEALTQARRKKGDLPGLRRIRLEHFEEGLCMQIMHLGPYADEPATVALMDAYAQENGCTRTGKHHEIYLGNPLRADPAKLKTILRHPVRKS